MFELPKLVLIVVPAAIVAPSWPATTNAEVPVNSPPLSVLPNKIEYNPEVVPAIKSSLNAPA